MSSQQHPENTSIKSKLTTLLVIVAIMPLLLLTAGIMLGAYQPIFMIGALFCQLVGIGLGWHYGSKMIEQANEIRSALTKISAGDFEARSKVASNDELGATARELNAICDNTLNLIQSSEEREQIQNSIEALNSEMKEIAAGDLEIRAAVKDDITGSIADSVNNMTQQLKSIVGQVKTAANQVNRYSTSMREISEAKSVETDSHAQLIQDASEQILAMTSSFQKVATMTSDSAQVAVETKQSASKGQKAVSATVDGMNRIRNQVQNTSKRIKRLGESSQEIGEIVQLISEISDRTSVLALNASIQASMAGDAGRGFAVIAQEIERLAERSTDATLQISKLIRAVQNETGEVIADMEESTREVVAGSQLATQAGATLFEIDSVANQLVELIQSSSNYALRQADAANVFASSMSEISISTKRSAEYSRESTKAAGLLDDMVHRLSDSVSQFKIAAVDNDPQLVSPVTPVVAPKKEKLPPEVSSYSNPFKKIAAVNGPMESQSDKRSRVPQKTRQPVKKQQPSQTQIQDAELESQIQQAKQQQAKRKQAEQQLRQSALQQKALATTNQQPNDSQPPQTRRPQPTMMFDNVMMDEVHSADASNTQMISDEPMDEQLLKQTQNMIKEVDPNRAKESQSSKSTTGKEPGSSQTLQLGDS